MTSKEFIKALEILKWNHTQAGNNLGISRRTVLNYLSGKRNIPLYIEKFLKLYAIHNRVVSLLSKVY